MCGSTKNTNNHNFKNNYHQLFDEVKTHISKARIDAIRTVNRNLIQLYWEIGKLIHQKQEMYGWGKSVVEQLSIDLRKVFPHNIGLSSRNLWEMRRFYHFYCNKSILQQLVAEIPWGHNLIILRKLKDEKEIEFYVKSASKLGWSRNVLLNQIKSNAYQRRNIHSGQHNFDQTLNHQVSIADYQSIGKFCDFCLLIR